MSSTMTRDRRPKVGDRAWQVDWCADLPKDENGDNNMDAGDYRSEAYKTKAAAVRRAKAVLPIDAFGSVQVTPVAFTAYDEIDAVRYPHAGFWEPIGEVETLD